MTRIDFYILPEGGEESAAATAAKLCDKAAAAWHKIYVHVPDAALAQDFDGLLWSLRQGSFLAHERYLGKAGEAPLPYIYYGEGEPPDSHLDVLVNLGLDVPGFFSRFERVCELVSGDPQARAQSRVRYKFYKERGYELKTFEQDLAGGWKQKQ